ncbi:MAG: DegT/DnrJ/EryC1/StrS family aminotransferase [Planctomycetota bacterium]
MAEKLAIDGGPKVWNKPAPQWPAFDMKVMKDIEDILKTGRVNYWTGPRGMEFEKKFAKWNGAAHAISTSNGTTALHTAVAALGIGPGDEVIVTSYSFIASSFCVLQAGAIPVFADVNKEDHMISPKSIESKITKRTKAIIVVHLYGIVADMDPILKIAKKHNLFVIEDCAQAHGGVYKGKKTATVGDVGCYSFCQSKHFTTGGEGGMVVTDDEDLAWECRSFRDHGYDVKERLNLLEMEAKLMYIHKRVGFNYRMTEIQSAIGLRELARFDRWNMPARRRNGKMLQEGLKGVPGILYLPPDTKARQNAYWWFPIVLDIDKLTVDAVKVQKALAAEGLPCYTIQWPEMYQERAYREHHGFGPNKFPFRSKEYTDPKQVDYSKVNCENARWLRPRTLSFFTHPTYGKDLMRACVKGMKKVLAAYAR